MSLKPPPCNCPSECARHLAHVAATLPTPPEGSREPEVRPEAFLGRMVGGSREKDWREARFNEIFKDVTTINNTPIAEIRELFHSYEEEVRGMVEGMKLKEVVMGHKWSMNDAGEGGMETYKSELSEEDLAYNQALTDVLEALPGIRKDV